MVERDDAGFEAFYRMEFKPLIWFAARTGASRSEAEDIAQVLDRLLHRASRSALASLDAEVDVERRWQQLWRGIVEDPDRGDGDGDEKR